MRVKTGARVLGWKWKETLWFGLRSKDEESGVRTIEGCFKVNLSDTFEMMLFSFSMMTSASTNTTGMEYLNLILRILPPKKYCSIYRPRSCQYSAEKANP